MNQPQIKACKLRQMLAQSITASGIALGEGQQLSKTGRPKGMTADRVPENSIGFFVSPLSPNLLCATTTGSNHADAI
jgi:hypothetical protein